MHHPNKHPSSIAAERALLMVSLRRFIATLALLAHGFALAAVDVNTASENDLDSIKGIGPSTATRVLTARRQAPFKDWNDFIQRLSGIGEKRAAKLSAAGLTVNGKPYTTNHGSGNPALSANPSTSTQTPGSQRNLPIAIAPRY